MMHFFYLANLFLIIVVPIVKMALKALGIGVIAYIGINLVIDQAKDYVLANVGNALPAIQMILGLAKIDVAVNMYFAAITTRMVLSGLNKLADRKSKMGHMGSIEA
jgi:hypothetical protein